MPQPGPKRRAQARNHHRHKQAHERQTNLPEVEAVVGAEDERERAEEEVQQAEQDGGVNVEDDGHGLEDEDLEGAEEGVADCLGDGFGGLFDGRPPAVVACLFALEGGFAGEEDGV